jgi:ABC-type multidrug transport system fused ATPase/permease subunit
MDEATAAIDYKTDAKIQETIRQLQSTTITIAHRLGTVVENDRIVVLDQGMVKEFGTPHELLQMEGGLFYEMCLDSGEMEVLAEKARRKHEEMMRRHV